uniref:Uncharacterized protein, isoform N n=1 Tax=Drosophila melanogaster TaxID=7227 RepID=A0A6M3Q9B5_DROME|nr:uncharacterized protein Dmel_CG17574, isoform N [Drosophila melanogaster]QJC18706.1 uncharacterized protein Dmel_CG17574, isoform N [Drosophila melanogaster]
MVNIYFDIWFPIIMVVLYSGFDTGTIASSSRPSTSPPVVVTSATHTAPGGYPVTQLPPPGYPSSNAYVTATSYPVQTTGNVTVQMPMPMSHQNQQQMPMPMPMPGQQTHGVAYPTYPGAGAANMNPPPYDMSMANPGPSVMPAGYEKQAPYNPHFGQ